MRKIVVGAMISMDGVMRAPGGPTDHPTKGFKFGGWAMPCYDHVFGEEIDRLFKDFDLLLGRKTYEIFAGYWPYQAEDGEFGAIARQFRDVKKYVVSRSGEVDMGWQGSVLLRDIAELTRRKQEDGPNLVTQGSTELVHALFANDLVDRISTFTIPIVLRERQEAVRRRLGATQLHSDQFARLKQWASSSRITSAAARSRLLTPRWIKAERPRNRPPGAHEREGLGAHVSMGDHMPSKVGHFFWIAMLSASLTAGTACSPPNQRSQGQVSSASAAHSTPTNTGYADVEGGRIYYQVYGALSSGRTPLLVLHGSFMSGDAMGSIVDAFASSRPVIALDARGHGRTGDLPGSISYELLADDAAAVLAALNMPRADVLGYSMGGTTAIFMAIRHPNRVGKQIILAGTSRRDGWYPEVLQAMAQATPAVFAGSPIEAEYRRLSPTPDRFATFVEEVLALEELNYASSNDAVRAIGDKTMIILGDADGVALEHAIELFKLRGGGDREAAARGVLTEAPHARLAILPAMSHVGLMGEAARIAELATPFLDDRRPPRPTGFFEGMDSPSSPASDKR